jgi:hypothetical protein
MNIYDIRRLHCAGDYDTTHEAIVVANNSTEARELMKKDLDGYAEDPTEWDPENSKCTLISKYTGRKARPFILLIYFLHG